MRAAIDGQLASQANRCVGLQASRFDDHLQHPPPHGISASADQVAARVGAPLQQRAPGQHHIDFVGAELHRDTDLFRRQARVLAAFGKVGDGDHAHLRVGLLQRRLGHGHEARIDAQPGDRAQRRDALLREPDDVGLRVGGVERRQVDQAQREGRIEGRGHGLACAVHVV